MIQFIVTSNDSVVIVGPKSSIKSHTMVNFIVMVFKHAKFRLVATDILNLSETTKLING